MLENSSSGHTDLIHEYFWEFPSLWSIQWKLRIHRLHAIPQSLHTTTSIEDHLKCRYCSSHRHNFQCLNSYCTEGMLGCLQACKLIAAADWNCVVLTHVAPYLKRLTWDKVVRRQLLSELLKVQLIKHSKRQNCPLWFAYFRCGIGA